MNFTLTFLGAAETVTGSMHLVEFGGKRILLDCGLFQGQRKTAFEQNRNPRVDAKSIDAVLLSHAHMDHSGNLPTFQRLGFQGKIYATPATRDLAEVILRDSANLQVREVELVNRQRKELGKKAFEPLYEEKDVDLVMNRFVGTPYGQRIDLGGGLAATFHDSGHILGSSIVLLEIGGNGSARRLLFTGDLGRKDCPILNDPEPVQTPDYVISESTYGDRKHPECETIKAQLQDVIETVRKRKSKLIVPAFSIGRTQQIIYYLHELYKEGRISGIPIYVDSPLSNKATEVFIKHPECYDAGANAFLTNGETPFGFHTLHYVETVEESKRLNNQAGPLVILAGSGMCEGGRVLHHLVHGVSDPANIVLLTGFQAQYTLGRRLADGVTPVNILGGSYPVRAKVQMIEALSAHADADEIIEYFKECHANPAKAFLVHGEPAQAEQLRGRLTRELKWKDVQIPKMGQEFSVEM